MIHASGNCAWPQCAKLIHQTNDHLVNNALMIGPTDGRDDWSIDKSISGGNGIGNGPGKLMMTPGLFEPVITETWVKWIWLDCLQYNIQIQSDLPEFQPNCSNDIELMRVFSQHLGTKDKNCVLSLTAICFCR